MLGMHVALGNALTLRTAMTVLASVNLLRSPLLFLPLVLQSAQEARTSLGRMQGFLNGAEVSPLESNRWLGSYHIMLLLTASGSAPLR